MNIKSLDLKSGQILMVDKPKGWTSFDVVKKIRGILKAKKVGHAGTLDPMATGLLILAINEATKQLTHLQQLEKTYIGTIILGKTTPSMDAETDVNCVCDYHHITAQQVKKAAAEFVGSILQTPPIYSAIKVKGKRAYQLARLGMEVKLTPRMVCIESFCLTKIELPTLHFELVCSKGTYVRSLAHDLGQNVGVGGYLGSLRRTQIGPYHVDQAIKIEQLMEQKTP